jgi:hypothetical protein
VWPLIVSAPEVIAPAYEAKDPGSNPSRVKENMSVKWKQCMRIGLLANAAKRQIGSVLRTWSSGTKVLKKLRLSKYT